jgi:phosphatidylglycerophosphate synthase
MSHDKDKLRSCIKEKDGWWASVFAGPLANRLLEPICEIAWLTPNQLTIVSFFVGLIATYFFAKGDYSSLVIAAVLVQLSFIIDCMDGQFARYSKKFSDFGAWLDRISDRIKDFAYFFALAWGFFHTHSEYFEYGLTPFVNFLSRFISIEQYFKLSPTLHMITMQGIQIPSWIAFPVAMLAMFTVFLIDYYVNQDMKFPFRGREEAVGDNASSSPSVRSEAPSDCGQASNNRLIIDFSVNFLKSILKFGLSVYKAIPILRFNIGEQALLITIFCLLNSVFSLLCFFSLLGSFYVIYWPFAKYYGFTEAK